jgi:hypothetical protein
MCQLSSTAHSINSSYEAGPTSHLLLDLLVVQVQDVSAVQHKQSVVCWLTTSSAAFRQFASSEAGQRL